MDTRPNESNLSLMQLPKRWQQPLRLWAEQWRDRLAGVDGLPQLALLGLLTGLLAGLVIILFRWLVEIPLSLWLPQGSATAKNYENFEALNGLWHFALPLGGAIVLGVILQFIDKRYHASGIAHVIDRLQNHQGRLPLRNLAVQFFGGAACLLSGQSVGREGPAVHLGAGVGSLLGQWLKLPGNSLRPLAGCGVAAAIGACFNTPMAGVIFAMEVVVMGYSITGFIPVILAAIAGTALSHLAFGNVINFELQHSQPMALPELPLLALAGLFISLLSAAYIRLQAFWCKRSLNLPIALRFALAGLITGTIAYGFPSIMGLGYDTIGQAIGGELGVWLLLGILLAKLLATSAGLGLGIPGGVIGPLLFMGACAGGAIGVIANQLMPHWASPIGFYVVLGMGAMMGATLNAPLAAMVAILELTYSPGIIFPSMLMVVVACLVTRWLFRCDGLYETLLKIQGKFRTPEISEQLLSKTGTRQLLNRHVQPCPDVLARDQVSHLLTHHPHWLMVGRQLLAAQDLAAWINQYPEQLDIRLADIAGRRLDMIELPLESTLYEAKCLLQQAQVEAGYLNNSEGVLIGIVTLESINNYYTL